jgi:hypothetical protein
MIGSNKNVIIGGIFALLALMLLLTTHRDNGKISFLNGLFVIETGTSNPPDMPKAPTKKVSVIGRISINGRQATEQDITEVFLKNDNSVNRDTPSGDGFTLKNVTIPSDNRLDITVAFKDKTMASRVFNIPEPVDGKADIGELRITIEKPTPPKNGKVSSSKPTIVINNNFIVNN